MREFSERNCGSTAARNKGLKVETDKYITFLDSDDLIDPNYLGCQLYLLKIIDRLFQRDIEDKQIIHILISMNLMKLIIKKH